MTYRNRRCRRTESRGIMGRRRLFENWNKIRKEAEAVLHDVTLGSSIRKNSGDLEETLEQFFDYTAIFHDEYQDGYAYDLDDLWDELVVKKWRYTKFTVRDLAKGSNKYY